MKFFDTELLTASPGSYFASTPEWHVGVERLTFCDAWVAAVSRSPNHSPHWIRTGSDPVKLLAHLERVSQPEIRDAFSRPAALRFQNTELRPGGLLGTYYAERGEFRVCVTWNGDCEVSHRPTGKILASVTATASGSRQGNLDELARRYAGTAFK